jgi:hypothetical protein
VWVVQRQPQGDSAAQRLSDYRRSLDPQLVHEGETVGDEAFAAVGAGRLRLLGAAVAAEIWGYGAKTGCRENFELPAMHVQRGTPSVKHHDGSAARRASIGHEERSVRRDADGAGANSFDTSRIPLFWPESPTRQPS